MNAKEHADDCKDAGIKSRETFRVFQPYCPGCFKKTRDKKKDPLHSRSTTCLYKFYVVAVKTEC